MAKIKSLNEAVEYRAYKIILVEKLLGTIPKNKELFTKWVLDKYYNGDDVDPEIQEEYDMNKEIEESLAPEGEGETGFFTDSDGIYIMDYHVRGFLKNAGNVLKDILGIRNLRSKIENYVFVLPRHIFLKKKPDGRLQRPLRGQTPRGVRVTLVSSDYVNEGTSFNIVIEKFRHREITWNVIESLLDYGSRQGLCQWRTGGYGRFKWERIAVEESGVPIE